MTFYDIDKFFFKLSFASRNQKKKSMYVVAKEKAKFV